jgi:hypothetical protein
MITVATWIMKQAVVPNRMITTHAIRLRKTELTTTDELILLAVDDLPQVSHREQGPVLGYLQGR